MALNTNHVIAENVISNEYQVKTGFLLNFARFTEWPSNAFNSSNAPLVLMVLGENHFGNNLDSIRDKAVNDHKLAINFTNDINEANNAHILFISQSKADALPVLLKNVKPGALLISDIPNFASRGGMIGFIVQDNKIRFEINVEAAKRSGLIFSSKLLSLAKIVSSAP